MDAQNETRLRKSGFDILVGIEAGILGGAIMLGWFALMAPLLDEPWWSMPNRLGSALFAGATRSGFGLVTLAGVAVHLCTSGLAGAVHGILTPGGRLFGLGFTAALYLINYLLLWKKVGPALLYAPQPLLFAGYFLFGSVLGQHSRLLARARQNEARLGDGCTDHA